MIESSFMSASPLGSDVTDGNLYATAQLVAGKQYAFQWTNLINAGVVNLLEAKFYLNKI